MGFTRFVEVGRVAAINYGPDAGKLCTIIEILDGKRVLVDGPTKVTGIGRQVITLKRLSLTDIVVPIFRNATQKSLEQAWEQSDALNKWDNTPHGKKLAMKRTRASLTDFDRFKVMVAKKQKASIVAKAL